MSRVLLNSSFNFKNQISKYVGKVRDVYELKDDISKALSRREALLRLVDPICLGDFKWFVFSKFKNKKTKINSSCIR